MTAGSSQAAQQSLGAQYPDGCFIGFNAAIDRKAAEQLVFACGEAVKNGFREITLCMSSVGGLLDHAHYAFNMLEAMPVKITTHNTSSIQSAANLLFLAGDERYAADKSTFFFHQTTFEAQGGQTLTQTFLTERLKAMAYEDDRSASIYATKTGQPVEKIREWLNTELVMTTDVAVKNGLIHAVKPLVIPKGALYHQVVV